MFLQVVVGGVFSANMTNPVTMMHNTTASTVIPPRANATTFFTSKVDFVLKNQVWLLNHFQITLQKANYWFSLEACSPCCCFLEKMARALPKKSNHVIGMKKVMRTSYFSISL